MKSKEQKRQEAIERNAQYRDKYLKEAAELYPKDEEKQKQYADVKQGIGKGKRNATNIQLS